MSNIYVVRDSSQYYANAGVHGVRWLNASSRPKAILAPAKYNIVQNEMHEFITDDTALWYDKKSMPAKLDRPSILVTWPTIKTVTKYKDFILTAAEVLILEHVPGELNQFLTAVEFEDILFGGDHG